MEISYQKLHDICAAFHTLSIQEYKIFEVLFSVTVFDGGYSRLGRIVGMEATNVRKAVKKMERRGIVCVVMDCDNPHKVKGMFLMDGWQDELLRTAHKFRHSFEDCKKPHNKETEGEV